MLLYFPLLNIKHLLLLNQKKPYIFLLPMSWYVYLHLLHLFTLTLIWFGPTRTLTMELGNQTDHLALLQFKQLISNDPYGILDSWNSSTHFCKWHGIICSPKNQRVTKLKLDGYVLHGSISPYVGNLSHLRFLNLGDNNFYGNIPQELGRLSRLRYVLLVNNSLDGEFPINLTKCYELKTMRLTGNKLIGKIPRQIGSLQKLQKIFIGGNNLSGKIPPSIRNLSSLTMISVGFNNLVGNIPQEMCFRKQLKFIAVHVNKLSEGEVPTDGVFGNATQVAIIGNNKLCGGISQLHLPPCLIKGRKHTKHHKFGLIAVIVGVVSFLLILSFIITMYWMRKRNLKQNIDSPTIDQLAKVSYQELNRGTDGFSTRNLIGSGSFGSVYRGNLVSEDNVVAVKVLNLQKKGARKSFFIECNALKNIRHRNLVKVLTCCSSTDYKGQEFKALVFDYMKNGSLEPWLHPEILNAEPPTTLDLSHRLNIIIDVASALHYLHHECEQLVIHCDLKPSNVLLDEDMVAHVSDFGIARLVSTISGNTSTIGIKGSVGYAPPEYGMGSEVSISGDMYSFGVLVLEMLTGRRPTDEIFKDGQNLHNLVAISFPDNLGNICNPHLVSRDAEVAEDGHNANLIPTIEECLVSLFRIGLICSMESPKERMNIVDVTRELNIIRKTFLAGFRSHN
ncbi:probable LRR receptor-like serine/threonine-protein kinase At3g47570 isoform X2 [Trifolium pratense]|uniref:probable LRR receptor-like serine/threonine-protein kinase At3g47570 isoform X2 n=1 Tax=Trifolium pratense TaxID=57577 RepID=UPI001E695F18|nr:probable LRR receptor-like serine/threonine-protein kinase At3g47570 isoform X2 [Trifolium pratense]